MLRRVYHFAECLVSPCRQFRRVPFQPQGSANEPEGLTTWPHFAEKAGRRNRRLGERSSQITIWYVFAECHGRQKKFARRSDFPGDQMAPGTRLRRVPLSATISSPCKALGELPIWSEIFLFFQIPAFLKNSMHIYIYMNYNNTPRTLN